MSLTVEELRSLAQQTVAPGGSDGPSVRATEVVPHLDSDDRNVRVAALRVLAWCDPDDRVAVDGLLRGLDDDVKRVREVAAKSTPRFVDDARIVERLLRAAVDDERGSSRPAMQVLGGMYAAPYGLLALEPVASAVAALAEHPKHRQQALLALLRAHRLDDDLVALLRRFQHEGSREEAVAATRRLDGFRVAHSMEVIGDSEVRKTAERAFGDAWFWLPADRAPLNGGGRGRPLP